MNIFKALAFLYSWGNRILKHVIPNRGKKLMNNFLNFDLKYFACFENSKNLEKFSQKSFEKERILFNE